MSISYRLVTIEDYDGIFALWNSSEQSHHGIVHHLCVNPSYRREGIATTLVQKAEEALHAEAERSDEFLFRSGFAGQYGFCPKKACGKQKNRAGKMRMKQKRDDGFRKKKILIHRKVSCFV